MDLTTTRRKAIEIMTPIGLDVELRRTGKIRGRLKGINLIW